MEKFFLVICSSFDTDKFMVDGFLFIKMNTKELKQRYEGSLSFDEEKGK